jgi:hypothetical protein
MGAMVSTKMLATDEPVLMAIFFPLSWPIVDVQILCAITKLSCRPPDLAI